MTGKSAGAGWVRPTRGGEGRAEAVQEYFSEPSRYLRRAHGLRMRRRIVGEMLGQATGLRMVDLGCGDGSVSFGLADRIHELTLVDTSPSMLALAEENVPPPLVGRVSFLEVDATDPTVDGTFDVVLCLGLLAHVPDVAGTVARIAAMLAPNGCALLQFSDRAKGAARVEAALRSLRTRARSAYGYELNHVTTASVVGSLRDAGLGVVDEARFWPVFPGMGALPGSWVHRYQVASESVAWLSALGSEVIVKAGIPDHP